MGNFFALIVFAVIGSLFGPVGFFIGLGLGIIGWIASANSKNKDIADASKVELPVLTGRPRRIPPEAPIKQAQPKHEEKIEYATAVALLYSRILGFYDITDSSKVQIVTEILEHDDWIADKSKVLDDLASRVPHIQKERRDSPMLFELHNSALLERIPRFPSEMKPRMAMQLDSLFSGLSEDDSDACKEFVTKARLRLRRDIAESSERLEAEAFIMRSGDPKAISTLQEMRRNPAQYRNLLRSGAAGNTVLKTALGVFAGMLAAEAVKAAVTDYQLKNLLTQLDQQIAEAGGVDHVLLEDEELNALTASEPAGDTISNVNTDASASEIESTAVEREEGDTESIGEGGLDAGPDECDDAETNDELSDSGSDLLLD